MRGIERMVDKKRSCSDILQQVSAIKKAIDGMSKEIIISDICRLMPKGRSKKLEKMVERAISL